MKPMIRHSNRNQTIYYIVTARVAVMTKHVIVEISSMLDILIVTVTFVVTVKVVGKRDPHIYSGIDCNDNGISDSGLTLMLHAR